jgi:hypothetical protein
MRKGTDLSMAESTEQPKSKAALTALLIVVSGIAVFAAIVVPPYLRDRSERRRGEELAAAAQPTLDALITAEAAYKEREGKFWREKDQVLTPEATKQTLGVELPSAYRFMVDPPDLVADPTLRVAAKGVGPAEGFTIECVYDSIAKTKSCKRV